MSLVTLLTYLGGFVVLKALYDLVRFLSLYIRPSVLHKYVYGSEPYALITGASDGIGKATAQQLYNRGFNVIIHGRNEAKLRKVANEIRGNGGPRDVRIWVADANSPSVDYTAALEEWKELELTLVVHNLGGAPPRPERFDQVLEQDIVKDIQRNALFPFHLTRALLPKLRRASGPVQIVFVGSFSGAGPIPRLIPYSPSKSFIRTLSGAIDLDEQFGGPTNVSTMHVMVGSVESASHKVRPSLFSPSADTFAKALVDHIGCGRRFVAPYLPHAFQFWSALLLPESLWDKLMSQAMEDELKLVKKNGHNW